MIDLETATTPTNGVFDVPEGWRLDRGAYGGLVIAALVRAAEQQIHDPARVVRSVTAEIPAPVEPGRAEIVVEILRAGNAVTTARVALRQGNEVRAHAIVIAAAARREAPSWNALVPPYAPAWDALGAMPASPVFPEFGQHFDYRIAEGLPVSGAPPHTIGWIRPRLPGTKRDAAFIAAVIDAWYPGALVHSTQPRPMGTLAFTLEVVGNLQDHSDEPLLYRGVAPVCTDGYSLETRELWRADGRLVARNHQTFVIIK